jgi:FKBP-type peptidyl-prolyl cis-trans isomerase
MNKSIILTIPLTAILALIGCNQENSNSPSPQPEKTEPVAVQPAAAAPQSKDLQTCTILGEYLAVTAGLKDLNFTDEEKAAIAEGFKNGLSGSSANEASLGEENFAVIREYLQAKHMAKAAADSAVNKKLTAEYVETLKKDPRVQFSDSGLGFYIKNPGEFDKPTLEDSVSVTYRGTLIDGTEFDSAMDATQPVTFPLAGVIPGFSEGLQLVGKGGEIRLYIPSELGYGDNPRPGSPIGAGAMLIFDVTIVDVQRSSGMSLEDLNNMPPPPPPPPPPVPEENQAAEE